MGEYRIAPDTHSLCIEKKFVAGKDAKEPGKETWRAVAWPGKLHTTAQSLLEILVRERAEQEEIVHAERLVEAVEQAKREVRETVDAYMEREGAP